jgi:hypothetical protein
MNLLLNILIVTSLLITFVFIWGYSGLINGKLKSYIDQKAAQWLLSRKLELKKVFRSTVTR